MTIDRAELRRGLRETRKFVLSHHPPSEYYRCYSTEVAGRQLHVCARCLGIYPGIAAGVLAYRLAPPGFDLVPLVALLPLPAFLDWAATTFRDARGYNGTRTATGALLGFGYGLGVSLLLFEFETTVLLIGALYAVLAGVSLYRAW